MPRDRESCYASENEGLLYCPLRSVQCASSTARTHPRVLVLLLGRRLGLGRLLPITPDHDHAQERAYDSGAEKDEDDGDANGPLAGEEEVLEGVVVVDEGHEESPDAVVEEYEGGGHEHGETD